MKNRVDILLACYQGEAFLKEQLHSILEQSYQNLHLLIRDDGSTDETLTIIHSFLKEYPEKISLIPSHQRVGIKGNFSELMNHSQAKYIMFSDQDDVWKPNKVELSLKKMKHLESLYGNRTPLLVHSDMEVVHSDLSPIAPSFWKYAFLNPSWVGLNYLLMQNCVTGCTMMINREVLKISHPIPPQSIMHDWWIALVTSLFGKIDSIEEPTLYYRQHGRNSVGAQKGSFWKFIRNRIYPKEKNLSKYEQAQELLNRYSTHLNAPQKEVLSVFCSLKNSSFVKKMRQCIKYRFIPRH